MGVRRKPRPQDSFSPDDVGKQGGLFRAALRRIGYRPDQGSHLFSLPARTWPSAMLIITTMASPARAFILARPLMKCLSKPKLWSMRLLIRSSAVRRL